MSERTVTLTRVFDAPIDRVFAAWTRAEHLVHWFGPKRFSVHSCETDPRPGGLFRLCMRSPQGQDYWVRGAFREVRSPERVVIDCSADDHEGITRLHEVIDVTFTEERGRTTVTLNATARGTGDVADSMLGGMEQGWAQTIDRLGQLMKGNERE